MPVKTIISGGQTGVDRAALDIALELKIPCGGWCPKGRQAEDGAIDPMYPLQETPLANYAQRTEWNVRDTDGTLILTWGSPSGGTAYTIECAKSYRRPLLIGEMKKPPLKTVFLQWITEHQIQTLNVAGPRESLAPGVIYREARQILTDWLGAQGSKLEKHKPASRR
ncbi:MAG: putative molybdenum carrier protein [Deltaproteobacteria bacterium]|nr:putative molybdenum carrier protein [Deltaproteobacteria bacterium]